MNRPFVEPHIHMTVTCKAASSAFLCEPAGGRSARGGFFAGVEFCGGSNSGGRAALADLLAAVDLLVFILMRRYLKLGVLIWQRPDIMRVLNIMLGKFQHGWKINKQLLIYYYYFGRNQIRTCKDCFAIIVIISAYYYL